MAKAFDLRVGITFEGHDQPGRRSHRASMKWEGSQHAPHGTSSMQPLQGQDQIPSWGLYKARTRITLTHPPVCIKTHRLKPVGQFSTSIPALGSRQLVPLPADPALLFLLGGQLWEQRGEADQASAAIARPEASWGSWHFLARGGQVKGTPEMCMRRWNCVLTLYNG